VFIFFAPLHFCHVRPTMRYTYIFLYAFDYGTCVPYLQVALCVLEPVFYHACLSTRFSMPLCCGLLRFSCLLSIHDPKALLHVYLIFYFLPPLPVYGEFYSSVVISYSRTWNKDCICGHFEDLEECHFRPPLVSPGYIFSSTPHYYSNPYSDSILLNVFHFYYC